MSLDRASSVLQKYLTSRGIRFSNHGEGRLSIQTPGGPREVVLVSDDAQRPPEGVLVVKAKELTSRKLATSVAAFTGLMAQAGMSTESPVPDRGVSPEKKLHFSDHFDEVAMRHSEFRKSPNLPEEKVKAFLPIIKNLARSFYARNRRAFDTFGYDDGDLQSFGMVWLHNYFGIHRKAHHKDLDDRKLFTQYMKQRQVEFLDLIHKKARNVLPDESTLAAGLYTEVASEQGNRQKASLFSSERNRDNFFGRESEGSAVMFSPMTDSSRTHHRLGGSVPAFFHDPRIEIEPSPEYVSKHQKLDVSSPTKRRNSAVALLEEGLGKMDHDKLLTKLSEVVESHSFCEDTRAEARRRLASHFKSCSRPECLAKGTPFVHPDEDVSSVDAAGL